MAKIVNGFGKPAAKPAGRAPENDGRTAQANPAADNASDNASEKASDNASENASENVSASVGTKVKVRKKLAEEAKKIYTALRAMGMDKLAAETAEIVSRATRDKFTVCFVGEFSHGKSTLINRIIGKDVLPVDDFPTTALLTRISFGKAPQICVLDNSGKVIERLPLEKESWAHLTAYDENGDENDMNSRRFIRVFTDSPWLRASRLEIFDTPGANDGSKERDIEISKALMAADGAVICLDAQKGLMETQIAFIKDRLLAPKVPYIALALTHLDLIAEENRDKVILNIFARLKSLKIEMPVFIANDITTTSGKFADITGLDKLKALLSAWSVRSDRAEKVEEWVAAGLSRVLDNACGILGQKLELISAKDEERSRMITEKQKVITDMHSEWEKIREGIKVRREECQAEFERKLHHERNAIVNSMLYRISTVPDPAKWYQLSYAYEISSRLSASIITLDNMVTEMARNDLEAVNREIVTAYRTSIERNAKSWGRTADSGAYVHKDAPEMGDVDKMRKRSNTVTAVATIAGGVVAGLTLGIGGIIGTVGASTVARHFTTGRIEQEVEKARKTLEQHVEEDVDSIIRDATRDCEGRISLIYGDISRAITAAESSWMQTQHELITKAAKPAEESDEKAAESINTKIEALINLKEGLNELKV